MDSDNNQIEEIKNKLDIVSVVEKYVKLRLAGKNYSGLCPFHTEKTPSFIVSPDLQRYKCFGCGETGDIYNFIQKIENIDFPEALEKLAKEAGVELKKSKPNSKFKTLEEINYSATKYYYNELKKDNIALKYLKERGFTEDSIKNFGVGYAPKYPKLKESLFKTKHYTEKQLLDSGLFTKKENSIKEKFYDRIMFPIRSKRGVVIGFTGRVLPGNDWGPKYMNSPETPLFHKKDNLFGQYESRQEIRKSDLVIMCEGSTDVISAHQHGIKNIVAPLGTGLTEEQLQSISTLTKNVLFFFDTDEAGYQALIRGFKLASELRLNPYATSANPCKDIDELLQKDPKLVMKAIKNKQEAFTFILTHSLKEKNLNQLEDLSSVRNFIGSLLDIVPDIVTRQHYAEKASVLTKISSTEFFDSKNTQNPKKNYTRIVPVKLEENSLEKKFLKLLLLLDDIKDENLIPVEQISSENFLNLYKVISAKKYSNKDQLYELLKKDNNTKILLEDLLFDLMDIPTTREEILEELEIVKRRLKEKYLKNKQKELSVKIAIAEEENNSKDIERYMKELTNINKMLKN